MKIKTEVNINLEKMTFLKDSFDQFVKECSAEYLYRPTLLKGSKIKYTCKHSAKPTKWPGFCSICKETGGHQLIQHL